MTVTLAGQTLNVRDFPRYTVSLARAESEKAVYPHSYGVELTPYWLQRTWSIPIYEDNVNFDGSTIDKLIIAAKEGESVKFDLDEDPLLRIQTIVYMTNINVGVVKPKLRQAVINLQEAYRFLLDDCESTSDWSVESGGGSLSLESSLYKQGENSLKLSGSILANTKSTAKYSPDQDIRIDNYRWVAFWIRTDNITDLDLAEIIFKIDATNYATYDFTSEITAIDKWYFIRIKQDDFTVTGTMDWDAVTEVLISMRHTTDQTYYFLIDELCAIE